MARVDREEEEKEKDRGEINEVVDTSLINDRYHDENAVSNRFMAADSFWLLLLGRQFRGVCHRIFFPFHFLFPLQYEILLTRSPDENSPSNLKAPFRRLSRNDVTSQMAHMLPRKKNNSIMLTSAFTVALLLSVFFSIRTFFSSPLCFQRRHLFSRCINLRSTPGRYLQLNLTCNQLKLILHSNWLRSDV